MDVNHYAEKDEMLMGDFEEPVAGVMEQRQEVRRAVDFRLGVILVGTSSMAEISVQACDLSTRGIGYRSRRRFACGEVVVLRMPVVVAGREQKLVLAQVRHCRTSPGQEHVVGAEFVESVVGVMVPARWVKLAREGGELRERGN